MSSGEVKKVSRHDIQLVQNLIERCLQLYMNEKEVVNTLLIQAKVEPSFTELVRQMSLQFASVPRPDQARCPVLPSSVVNDKYSSHQGIQVAKESSISAERIDMSTGMLPVHSQDMNIGGLLDRTVMKFEPFGYSNNSEFPFGSDGSFMEESPNMVPRNPPGPPFGGTELYATPLIESPMDPTDPTSCEFLNQNFSFSNLLDHDIQETYAKSPFLDPLLENFPGSAPPVKDN